MTTKTKVGIALIQLFGKREAAKIMDAHPLAVVGDITETREYIRGGKILSMNKRELYTFIENIIEREENE